MLVRGSRAVRGAIMKMFAKALLLPHVRAWSSNPPLPMKSARPEPLLPVRPFPARREALARTAVNYWKPLPHEGAAGMAPACGVAHSANGSARW